VSWAHGCGLVGVDGCWTGVGVGLTSKVLTGNGQDGRPAMRPISGGGFAAYNDAGTLA
jgi:hypothetical protein